MPTDSINAFAAAWAEIMWSVLWQSTLVVAAIAIIATLLARRSPAVRYWLWQLAAIKLLILPLWTVDLSILPASSPDVAVDSPAAIEVDSTAPPPTPSPASTDQPTADSKPVAIPTPVAAALGWQGWLLLAWFAVLVLEVVQLAVQRGRLRRLLATAQPLDGPHVQEVAAAAGALGLRRVPRALVATLACSPFVCGIRRPALVVSRGVLDDLAPEQFRSVVLHELAHVRRRDLVWGWTPEIARRIYFFHPLAYWIASRVRLERELAADELALRHGGGSVADYADTLVRVVGSVSGIKLVAGSAAFLGRPPE